MSKKKDEAAPVEVPAVAPEPEPELELVPLPEPEPAPAESVLVPPWASVAPSGARKVTGQIARPKGVPPWASSW